MFEAFIAAGLIALASIMGVVFFGHDKRLIGVKCYWVDVARSVTINC